MMQRPLEPGMVITIEPGLYFGIGADKAKLGEKGLKDWSHMRGIGIRIEDDILVTEAGYENLTRAIPKTVAEIEAACRKPSCVYPGICQNLGTDHTPLIQMYRRARALRGVKKILIGSGLRYDLAVQSPEYVKELVTHHVGGYLKIAPEHTEQAPLTLLSLIHI